MVACSGKTRANAHSRGMRDVINRNDAIEQTQAMFREDMCVLVFVQVRGRYREDSSAVIIFHIRGLYQAPCEDTAAEAVSGADRRSCLTRSA